MKKLKNILFAGLIIFILGLFNPIANASQLEGEALLSNEAVEEIREVALKKDKVLAVETEQIQSLKVKEGYISLQVVRESDTVVLNILNDELSEETNQEIKDNNIESDQEIDFGRIILLGIIAIFIIVFILSVVLAWCGTTIPRVFRIMVEDIKKGEGNKNG